MKKIILLVIFTQFLIGCAQKLVIKDVPDENAKRIEHKTHSIDFERITHSIPKGEKYEAVQMGFACELKAAWAVGGVDAFSRGPGTPLYSTQSEVDAVGLKRKDYNFLAFKTIEEILKKNNIKISSKTDLKLSALITDVRHNTCLLQYTTLYKGELYLKIKWKLYSKILKKDLYEKEFESHSEELEFENDNLDKIIVNAYGENVSKLINDEKFRNLIDTNNLYIRSDEINL